MNSGIRGIRNGTLALAVGASLGTLQGASLSITYYVEHAPPSGIVEDTNTLDEAVQPSLSGSGSVGNLASWAAEATYGSLKASTVASASGTAIGGASAQASSSPSWTDELTITKPGIATGTPGKITLSYAFSIEARAEAAGPTSSAGATYDLSVVVGSNNHVLMGGIGGGDPVQGFTTMEFDFHWGEQFAFSTNLGAYAGATASPLESASSSNTNFDVVLLGMSLQYQPEFGDFEPVSDFTVSAASGTSYPIPEPGTAMLVVCSLVAAGLQRRRRS